MNAVFTKILDKYLKHPIRWDAVFVILISLGSYWITTRIGIDTKEIGDLQNSLASTSISLAGFILTALTIIVTLRANLSYKGIEDSTNGLEVILNSWAYKQIVHIFKGAIQELVIAAIILYGTMLVNKSESRHGLLFSVCAGALLAIAFTTLRCLYILFNLVELEIKGRQEASRPIPQPKRWKINLTSRETKLPLPDEFTIEMREEEVEETFRPYN